MNKSVLSFKDKYFGDKNFYKMTLTIAIPIIIQNLLTIWLVWLTILW